MDAKGIRAAVDEILAQAGIKFEATYEGKGTDGEGWQHYKWSVRLTKGEFEMSQPYKMGLAHATPAKKGLGGRPLGEPKPTKPTPADVLYGLLLDASLASGTFDEFCGDLGYSTDSRKALATYLECQEIGTKARILLGPLYDKIEELLQEY